MARDGKTNTQKQRLIILPVLEEQIRDIDRQLNDLEHAGNSGK